MQVAEMLSDYLRDLGDEGARTDSISSQIKPVLREIGDLELGELSASTFEDYRRLRRGHLTIRGGPPSHATINRELTYVRAALRRLAALELIEHVPRFRLRPERGRRYDHAIPEEFGRILAELRARDPDVADLAEFLYLTGWRRREGRDLTWDEVVESKSVIVLGAGRSKNREERVFPCVGPLADIVSRRAGVRFPATQHVFHRGGRPIRCFRRVWKSSCEAAGVKVHVHGLRRSFATNSMNAGIPREIVMELAGWKTESIYRRYAIVDERAKTRAVERLSEFVRVSG